jgi:hypothetical protein
MGLTEPQVERGPSLLTITHRRLCGSEQPSQRGEHSASYQRLGCKPPRQWPEQTKDRLLREAGPGGRRVCCLAHAHTMHVQIRRERLSDFAVIIDHQDVGLAHFANPVSSQFTASLVRACGKNRKKLSWSRSARQFATELIRAGTFARHAMAKAFPRSYGSRSKEIRSTVASPNLQPSRKGRPCARQQAVACLLSAVMVIVSVVR